MPRLRPRTSIVLVLSAAVALVGGACSLAVDLNGYTGGAGEDGGPDAPVADGGDDTLVDAPGPDSSIDSSADAAPDADATTADAPDAVDASDAAEAAAADSTTDSASSDAADASEVAPDAADASDADASEVAADAAEAGPCAAIKNVGLSEVMVRAINGTGDNHEWFELTNYDPSCTWDMAGVRVTLVWASIIHVNYTIPAGTTLAPSASMVFADSKAQFLADASMYGVDASLVFDLGTPGGTISNNDDLTFAYYAPGGTLPFQTDVIKSRATTSYPTWPVIGQSYSFPSACDPSLRVDATGTTTTHWIDTPVSSANQYGSFTPPDAGVQPFYGTPGRANAVATTCPP